MLKLFIMSTILANGMSLECGDVKTAYGATVSDCCGDDDTKQVDQHSTVVTSLPNLDEWPMLVQCRFVRTAPDWETFLSGVGGTMTNLVGAISGSMAGFPNIFYGGHSFYEKDGTRYMYVSEYGRKANGVFPYWKNYFTPDATTGAYPFNGWSSMMNSMDDWEIVLVGLDDSELDTADPTSFLSMFNAYRAAAEAASDPSTVVQNLDRIRISSQTITIGGVTTGSSQAKPVALYDLV